MITTSTTASVLCLAGKEAKDRADNGMMGEETRSIVREYEGAHSQKATRRRSWGSIFSPRRKQRPIASGQRSTMPTWPPVSPSTSRRRHSVPAEAMLFTLVFNKLTSVSSLAFGFGSMQAFKAAVSLVDEGGLLLSSLKEDFFDPLDSVNGAEETAPNEMASRI